MNTQFIGNYKDINGDTVRVAFENGRYFYEVIDGTPDRWVSPEPPTRYRTLTLIVE